MKNRLTVILFCLAVLGSICSLISLFLTGSHHAISVLILLIGIIVLLEFLPIQMVSGESYSASSILVLFSAIYYGLDFAIPALVLGTIACFLGMFKTIKFPIFPFGVTLGMYMTAVLLAWSVWMTLSPVNIWIAAGVATFTYEMANVLLLEAIGKVTYGEKMFVKFQEKLKEVILPVLSSIIVIPMLLSAQNTFGLLTSMVYTLFFILVIIFFSRLLTQQIKLHRSTSQAFVSILEKSISPELAGHGNRVATIIETLMDDFDYPKGNRQNLLQAAVTHDIGKSLLPTDIFKKRGALTLSEEREYQNHSEKGVEVVKSMFTKGSFADWILYHHERWDGKGFPKGLEGENIPLESRILALGNELDHIFSRHDDDETILKLLKDKSGTVLDPRLVEKVNSDHIDAIRNSIHSVCSVWQHRISTEPEQKREAAHDFTSIGESFFIQVKDGEVISPNEELSSDFIQSLANQALTRQQAVHETYQHGDRVFDLHAQPQQNGEVTIFAHDLTPSINYRRQLEHNILESYEEIIDTLSADKVKFHSSKVKFDQQLGEWMTEINISKTKDVPKSREVIKPILAEHQTEIKAMKVHLSVTEAVTNVIKHANGGTLSVYRNGNTLQFLISDKGSGIPLHEIPKTILVTGYSSKRSLGQGFNMITKFSDHVQIHTSPEGTHILLEYKLYEEKNCTDKSDAS